MGSAQPFCLYRVHIESMHSHIFDRVRGMHAEAHVYNYNTPQLPLARPVLINAYGHLVAQKN